MISAGRKLVLLGHSGRIRQLADPDRIPFFTMSLYRPGVRRDSRVTKLLSFIFLTSFFSLLITHYSLLVPSAHSVGDSLYFIHTDHLGSTVAITDEDGELVSQSRYFPYGKDRLPITDNESQITERNYTSQIRDAETSLYYYNARYYDSALGMFTSPDSQGDALNRFAYVNNNPLIYIDPTGNQVYLSPIPKTQYINWVGQYSKPVQDLVRTLNLDPIDADLLTMSPKPGNVEVIKWVSGGPQEYSHLFGGSCNPRDIS